MMRRLYLAAALGFSLSCFAACFPSLSIFEGATGVGGAGANGPSGPGSGASTGSAGAQGTGASAGTGAGGTGTGAGGPCDLRSDQHGSPGVLNPDQTNVPGRCIDAEEASWKDYIAFLNAAGDNGNNPRLDAGSVIKACAAKDAIPDNPYRPVQYIWQDYDDAKQRTDAGYAGDLPVEGVDWCDAYLYCTWWAGKELCGSGNGSLVPAEPTPGSWARETEWFYACDALKWPDGGECYDHPTDPNGNQVLGNFPADSNCEAGGIHHMVSNVWEWENNCRDSGMGDPAKDDCWMRGQTDRQAGKAPPCDNITGQTNARVASAGDAKDHFGIRCCWDAR